MIYKHKKTGNYYETFDFVTFINATNAQADEEMIAYVKLPLSEENKTIFVRKKSEFYEKSSRELKKQKKQKNLGVFLE